MAKQLVSLRLSPAEQSALEALRGLGEGAPRSQGAVVASLIRGKSSITSTTRGA